MTNHLYSLMLPQETYSSVTLLSAFGLGTHALLVPLHTQWRQTGEIGTIVS